MNGTKKIMQGAVNAASTPSGIRPGTARRMLGFARPHRGKLAVFLAVTGLAAVMLVATPLLAGRVVDTIVNGGQASVVVWLAVVMAGVAITKSALGLAERFLTVRIGEELTFDLRRAVFEHVQRMSVGFFTRSRTGGLVSRLGNDVTGAQQAFTSTLSSLTTNGIQLILTLTVMVTLSWQVTVLALVLLPVFVLPTRRLGPRMARLQRESADLKAAMNVQLTERFSAPGATLVKLFGRPESEAAEFAAKAGRVRDITVRTSMLSRWFYSSLMLVTTLAQALVYGLGGYLALTGQLATGTVVALGLLISRLYTPLTQLANARVDVMTALVSFERVFEVLDLTPAITEKPNARPVPAGGVSVEFDRVRFGYLDDSEVLHDISLRAERGQLVALVGSSGAGKSTIASLVPRLYDVDSGAVRLSGVDVRDLSFASLRATVGVVTQDGHLFHDTIRANIAYARPEASEAEIMDAIHQARLGELVRSLPDGLDTIVGERGYRLSGGERQRLTIARLLLAQPRVVILDEATAHLDSVSEAAVQEALVSALAGRTALVIAHRLSTIRAADQILVVEEGKIIERGAHDFLLAAEGRYAELYATQFAGMVAAA